MTIYFQVMWVLSYMALVVLAVLGFNAKDYGVRLLVFLGVIVSAMIAAAHGMVIYISYIYFYMFPWGLYESIVRSLAGLRPKPEYIVLGWLLYACLCLAYVFAARLTVARTVWIIALIVMAFNIGGCNRLVTSMMNIP